MVKELCSDPPTKYLHMYSTELCLASSKILTPPTPLSTHWVCPPPIPKAGRGVHTRRAVRGWGSIFWKTPDIGLASYSIISLRTHLFINWATVVMDRNPLKGTLPRDYFFECKQFNRYFLCMRWWFSRSYKSFSHNTQINFFFASLKFLLNLIMLSETLIRISLSVIVMLTYCAAFFGPLSFSVCLIDSCVVDYGWDALAILEAS
jgi:hypothetical protein